MSETVRQSIYQAIASIRLIDPHTHINPHAPASTTLADILGYHYYTELAHSAGMAKSVIEEDGIGPRELVRRLVGGLRNIDNTANYAWLVQLCQKFFDFQDDRINESNWESLYDAAEDRMASAQWSQMVLDASNVQAVFLTNDFDDPLRGFDTDTYIPCLRTDDLVFHLAKPETQARLAACTGIELDGSLSSLRDSLRHLFNHFVTTGARACAISIPPTFEPVQISDGRASTALDHVLRQHLQADPSHISALSRRVFWTLAELCDEFALPFDLMIGVNRRVYPGGVYQGQDLYDSRVSLTQYRELFNAFPDVKFPISVLASVTNQELVSHAWIFPNVYTNGHWWYSNTPSFITRDLHARLEAVPRNKQVGYYSDAYKLEFVWPKFDMYRQILARVLTDHFVVGSGWSEEQAIALARQVLRGNVEDIFRCPGDNIDESTQEMRVDEPVSIEPPTRFFEQPEAAAVSSALAAGAIGMVEVEEMPEAASEEMPEAASEETYEESTEDAPLTVADELEETWDEHSTVADVAEEDVREGSSEDLMLDPLPTDDEVAELEVSDVELNDWGGQRTAQDTDAIEANIDDEPLDVGDLFGDEEESQSQIELLEGDSSFAPDDETLRLKANPVTGEWTMPVEESDEDDFVLDESDDEEN